MKKILCLALVLMALLPPARAFLPAIFAEKHGEEKASERADSEQPQQVRGGELFSVPKKYEAVYEAILTYLKNQDRTIAAASKETGQITTALEIRGDLKQTGTRMVITVIKEKEDLTSVRAIVTEQKRFKALQAKPWGDPVLEPKASAALREELQKVLAGA